MEPGIVKIADDNDFEMLKMLVDDHSNWKIEYERKEDGTKKVWTKSTTASSLKMVKVHTLFKDVHPNTVFDVLHDPDYRKTWDEHISQTDPRGKLPPWLVNKVSQKFAPKVVDNLKKAANGYDKWKMAQPNPYFKPWVSPEQTLQSPRISTKDCVQVHRTRRISDCDDDD
nr:unnamed protein product [Callosobruchus analis]